MKFLKLQKGYGTLIFMTLIGLLAVGSTVYYKTRIQQPESVRESYESTADELREISGALISYYRDNMAWPSTINELVSGGYFTGDASRCGGSGALQSPFCTAIFGSEVGENYTLRVNVLKESIARTVANQIPGGAAAGTTVTATINRPFQSALYDDYLQRVEDPDKPYRTQLEVDIDINNNDLNNIGSLNAQRATFDNADIENARIDQVNVELVKLGNNSISYSGNQLSIDADSVRVDGELSLNGDLLANGNDFTGFDTVKADTGVFDSINSNNAVIDNLSGDAITFNNGNIKNVMGDTLTFNNGNISVLNGDVLTYNEGTIGTLNGNSVEFISGLIGAISGNTLNYNFGTIDSLSGITISYVNINGTNGYFDSLSSNSAVIDNMNVTGSATFNDLSSSRADITNLEVSNGYINSGETNRATGNSITSTGVSTFDVLESDRIDTETFYGKTVEANTGSVSGDVSVDSITVDNLTVNNLLKTNIIESNYSSLGDASADQLTVANELRASNINVTTANITTSSIDDLNGTDASFNTITANRFIGGSFASDDDFYTPVSSVNKNHILITEQRDLLDNCVDVTKYCLPETPSVSLSCSSCNSAAARSSFSGTATGVISGCRQGCTYNWVLSGSGLNFSNCNSGSVPKGGSANPSCRVSTSLGPQESATGSIKLVVTNSHYTSRSSSDSVGVSYTNTTPNDPFRNVTAGCYVDTDAWDEARPNSCIATGWPSETFGAILSVGEYKGSADYLFYRPSDWEFEWSGDCSSRISQCSFNFSPGTGDKSYSASVFIRHKATGETRNFSVTVRFFTLE